MRQALSLGTPPPPADGLLLGRLSGSSGRRLCGPSHPALLLQGVTGATLRVTLLFSFYSFISPCRQAHFIALDSYEFNLKTPRPPKMPAGKFFYKAFYDSLLRDDVALHFDTDLQRDRGGDHQPPSVV